MNTDKELLLSCDLHAIPYFSLSTPDPILARCVSVYDGDTVTLAIVIYDKVEKIKARLLGIDTPEIRTRDDLEKKFGKEARDYLRSRILNKLVSIIIYCEDKYGRNLCELFEINQDTLERVQEVSINQEMIDKEYAFKYDGGTRQDWGEYLRR